MMSRTITKTVTGRTGAGLEIDTTSSALGIPAQLVAASARDRYPVRRLASLTPLDLPRGGDVDVAIIDVDNLVIDRDGGIDPATAMARLQQVYARLSSVEQTLAVMSHSAHKALGGEPWFRFPNWTWRVAEAGPDAADHQLIDFARQVAGQRPGCRVAVASGDGIFADLAEIAALQVVVPAGHRGISHLLGAYIRVGGSSCEVVGTETADSGVLEAA